jgi:uncharacterized protein (DUF983 family)
VITSNQIDDDRRYSKYAIGIVMLTIAVCFTAFFSLVWYNMERFTLPWHLVFIPLYILFSIAVLQAIISFTIALRNVCTGNVKSGSSLIGKKKRVASIN